MQPILAEDITAEQTKQRLLSDQSARELAPLLAPEERAFVSILATAQIYQLDPKPLLFGFADESGSEVIKELSARLAPGIHPLDAARELPNTMSEPCRVALSSARASGTLDSFYRSWLSQTVDDRIHLVRHENTSAAVVGRLGAKLFICLNLLTFILLYIVPEYMKMYEEFGIEINVIARTFFWVSNLIATFAVPFLLLITIITGVYLFFHSTLFFNYLRRWSPRRWKQTVLPKSILRRKLMAWDLLAFRGTPKPSKDANPDDTRNVDWDQMVAARELGKREADILKGTTRLETQAWLLRHMADTKLEKSKSRLSFAVATINILFQIALATIIILATFTVFSILLDLMNGLT